MEIEGEENARTDRNSKGDKLPKIESNEESGACNFNNVNLGVITGCSLGSLQAY